jgi:hypothetical protein
MGLERGPLSLVSTIEELYREMAAGIRHADHATPSSPQKLALTSLISGGPSVGIVLSRTEAIEFVFFCLFDGSKL